MTPTPPKWLLPWAKLGRAKDKVYPNDAHPLACHLLDVAHVALNLWSECLATSARRRWSTVLGLSEEEAGRWIAFWSGCHDIGKACPSFQNLDHSGRAKPALESAGKVGPAPKARHDHISAHMLPELWKTATSWPAIDGPLARNLAAVIGGHHGIIPVSSEYSRSAFSTSVVGEGPWSEVRREILYQLANVLRLAEAPTPQTPAGTDQAFYLILAGLISVADWIGSNVAFFEPQGIPADWSEYVPRSRRQAKKAVTSLGWTGWHSERSGLPNCPEVRTIAQHRLDGSFSGHAS